MQQHTGFIKQLTAALFNAAPLGNLQRGLMLLLAILLGTVLLPCAGNAAVAAPNGLAALTERAAPSGLPLRQQVAPKWCAPLGKPLRLVRSFEKPPHPYAAGHRGIDLDGDSTVYAPATGVVTFSGMVVDRPVLSIRVDDVTVYSLEPVRSDLQPGDTVIACQQVGEALGHTAAAQLHLGVRQADEYVNPLPFLAPRPRLLPFSGQPRSGG